MDVLSNERLHIKLRPNIHGEHFNAFGSKPLDGLIQLEQYFSQSHYSSTIQNYPFILSILTRIDLI